MTYEQFIGGLMPVPNKAEEGSGGFSFVPVRGYLLDAVLKAKGDKKVLLHIDEINRADLARVLGEAIYLFEPYAKNPPEITLSYDFEGFPDRKLTLPQNLHVIGTMNSADRSIAILDIAIRRRFCFERLYPQMDIVEHYGDDTGKKAFSELMEIFINNANDECFKYIPGHSYFMKREGCADTKTQIRTELLPLLREYLEQGFVSGFEDAIRAYIQRYEIICA
jgi:5-methylcytosine-specific restriction protein B